MCFPVCVVASDWQELAGRPFLVIALLLERAEIRNSGLLDHLHAPLIEYAYRYHQRHTHSSRAGAMAAGDDLVVLKAAHSLYAQIAIEPVWACLRGLLEEESRRLTAIVEQRLNDEEEAKRQIAAEDDENYGAVLCCAVLCNAGSALCSYHPFSILAAHSFPLLLLILHFSELCARVIIK